MSRPSRRKYGGGIMRRRIPRPPLFPGPVPSPPLPATRIVEPSCAPAGILTLIRSTSSVIPAPPHCGHPRRPDRPDPRHAGHALGRRYSRSRTAPFAMSRKSTGTSMGRAGVRASLLPRALRRRASGFTGGRVFPRQPPERLPDHVEGGVFRHAQQLVVVFLGINPLPSRLPRNNVPGGAIAPRRAET